MADAVPHSPRRQGLVRRSRSPLHRPPPRPRRPPKFLPSGNKTSENNGHSAPSAAGRDRSVSIRPQRRGIARCRGAVGRWGLYVARLWDLPQSFRTQVLLSLTPCVTYFGIALADIGQSPVTLRGGPERTHSPRVLNWTSSLDAWRADPPCPPGTPLSSPPLPPARRAALGNLLGSRLCEREPARAFDLQVATDHADRQRGLLQKHAPAGAGDFTRL